MAACETGVLRDPGLFLFSENQQKPQEKVGKQWVIIKGKWNVPSERQ
jgi:hypothetical protein